MTNQMNKQVPRKKNGKINWRKYNKELVDRGRLTVYFSKDLPKQWYNTPCKKKGAPFFYSQDCIALLHIIRFHYKLSLRSVAGFASDILKIMGLSLPVPDYSTLCRRIGHKETYAKLKKYRDNKEPVHLLIDSTGLKIFGDGEWHRKKHGICRRRQWRKLHLGVDEKSGQIITLGFSDNKTGDGELFPNIINTIEEELEQISVDGAYDSFKCYRAAAKRRDKPKLVAPPKQGAILNEATEENGLAMRNSHILAIREIGKKEWKKQNDYHRRSLVETAMYRFKILCGASLASRKWESQLNEVYLKCSLLNRMKIPSVL